MNDDDDIIECDAVVVKIMQPRSPQACDVANNINPFQGLSLNKHVVEIDSDGDNVEAVEREEEIIKKRKTELTTVKQIETRIKRNLVFENGRVIEDSGPIVETNTTEDTDKTETVQTEHRTLGEPNENESPQNAIKTESEFVKQDNNNNNQIIIDSTVSSNNENRISNVAPKIVNAIVTHPEGLVRELKEEVVVSREEKKELTETEEVKYLGDFSDDAYVQAVNSGTEDLREVLLSPDLQDQLVAASSGPKLVRHTTKSRKTVDSEETDVQCKAQLDGTLVTEKKQTRQHEVILDDDLPSGSGGEDIVDAPEVVINQHHSSQHYTKQRDEQHVEVVVDGQVVSKEMKYVAEQVQMDREGDPKEGLLSEWDSLSDRLRKARRLGRHAKEPVVGATPAAVPIADRTDALTKRPLDIDREEETRKMETSKWLESHFGSDSRSSRGSRDDLDEIVEPTKKTFFNVTIKTNQAPPPPIYATPIRKAEPNKQHVLTSPSKVVVPEKEERTKTKYFQGISDWSERKKDSNLKYAYEKRSQEHLTDEMPERDYNNKLTRDDSKNSLNRDDSAYISSSTFLTTPRSNVKPTYEVEQIQPAERPVVPQRKKAHERKVKQQAPVPSPQKHQEPPPDYPARSRSVSPIIIPPLRKPYQKTRFCSTQDISTASSRQTRAQSVPTNKLKVGSVIGNSIRKLVGKIRSASAERKFKLRSSSKHRSPSPQSQRTYQQYNAPEGKWLNEDSSLTPSTYQARSTRQQPLYARSTSSSSKQIANNNNKINGNIQTINRRDLAFDRGGGGSSDIISDMTTTSGPKQKYYLGEDPYGGSIFGKENKYDGQQSNLLKSSNQRYVNEERRIYTTANNSRSYSQPPPTSSTLGRFSKSTNRLVSGNPSSSSHYNHYSSTSALNGNAQTLPRKLANGTTKPLHSSTINVSIVNNVNNSKPLANTGPAKPARTYKAINRSKSFNVHTLNGTTDPSPIYIEKLSKNNYSSMYKSNPHLNESSHHHRPHNETPLSGQLKSPSIVNLISRSQRDLTQSPLFEEDGKIYSRVLNSSSEYKRNVLLKNLHNQSEINRSTPSKDYISSYVTKEQASSLGSRSPVTINKDTASIIRRGSSSTDDYAETFKFSKASEDPNKPGVTNTIKNFSKKTVPTKDGRGLQTIETSEIKTTTRSTYKEPLPGLKYQHFRNGIHNGNGGVVIEVRGKS